MLQFVCDVKWSKRHSLSLPGNSTKSAAKKIAADAVECARRHQTRFAPQETSG